MPVKLTRPLKREIQHDGAPYTVTVSAEGVAVVPKGKRKGHFLSWGAIIAGDATLRESLRISLDATAR